VSIIIAFAVATGAIGGGARAQTGADAASAVPVEIEAARPGMSIRLSGADGSGAPLACGERCTLNLPRGAYRLELTGPDGRVASRKLVVRRPSHVTVSPPDDSRRETGEILRDTGSGLILLGSGMLFYSLFHHVGIAYTCTGDCDEHAWVAYTGATAFMVGAVLGLTGRTIERSGSEPRLEVTHPSAPAEQRAWLSPAVGPRWTGLALSGRF
jgi:hypothetical protein